MNVDQVHDVTIHVILVTTDDIYADLVQTRLAIARSPFVVEQISPNDLLTDILEARLNAASEQAPALVILDVDPINAKSEALATRIVNQRSRRAVECVITRAAFDESVAERLHDLDG